VKVVVHAISIVVIALYHRLLTRNGPLAKNRKKIKQVEVKMGKNETKVKRIATYTGFHPNLRSCFSLYLPLSLPVLHLNLNLNLNLRSCLYLSST
jgi:hypothetical protein